MKLTTKERWDDEIRLKMIDKSEFYNDPQIYQYGFYDGYQLQFDKIEKAIDLIQQARTSDSADAILQVAILMLLKPTP